MSTGSMQTGKAHKVKFVVKYNSEIKRLTYLRRMCLLIGLSCSRLFNIRRVPRTQLHLDTQELYAKNLVLRIFSARQNPILRRR